jgi:hypothetical protein
MSYAPKWEQQEKERERDTVPGTIITLPQVTEENHKKIVSVDSRKQSREFHSTNASFDGISSVESKSLHFFVTSAKYCIMAVNLSRTELHKPSS